MARVTVEDCLTQVENRFDLVLKASKRAHQLELGAADPTVSADNDKPTVIALREIAAGNDITQTRTERDVELDLVNFDGISETVESIEASSTTELDVSLDMDPLTESADIIAALEAADFSAFADLSGLEDPEPVKGEMESESDTPKENPDNKDSDKSE